MSWQHTVSKEGLTICIISRVSAKDYELSRDQIVLEDILGEGQFGDVHRGVYREHVSDHYQQLTTTNS